MSCRCVDLGAGPKGRLAPPSLWTGNDKQTPEGTHNRRKPWQSQLIIVPNVVNSRVSCRQIHLGALILEPIKAETLYGSPGRVPRPSHTVPTHLRSVSVQRMKPAGVIVWHHARSIGPFPLSHSLLAYKEEETNLKQSIQSREAFGLCVSSAGLQPQGLWEFQYSQCLYAGICFPFSVWSSRHSQSRHRSASE